MLSPEEVAARLARLEGWAASGDEAIAKAYRFADFREAFAWMTLVALVADELDHHPRWTNEYGAVDVALTTHSAGGVTELDFVLAREMDQLADSVRG